MGITKSEVFTEDQNRLAKMAKALGHPARIAILQLLLKREACVCGELVDELPLSQSTISQHLKELKEAGIIQGDIEGTSVCYCINPENWSATRKQLIKFFDLFKEKNCC